MTPTTTPDALRSYLRGQGTDPEMIERHVARVARSGTVTVSPFVSIGLVEPLIDRLPVSRSTILLPWSCLVSSNERHRQFAAHSKAYTSARDRAHAEAAAQWKAAPIIGPVRVSVVFTYPNHGGPDPANLFKALLDALEGVCYENDRQARSGRWDCGAVDVDRPNATITVEGIDACS